MDDSPDAAASAKLAQHMAVAMQVVEAVVRLRQQAIERQTGATADAAAAARAEQTAQHVADRQLYLRAADPDWLSGADLPDLGQAWSAAAGWADIDPEAALAASSVENRLTETTPAAMARFTELRDTGHNRLDAMQDVAASYTSVATSADQRQSAAVGGSVGTSRQNAGRRARPFLDDGRRTLSLTTRA